MSDKKITVSFNVGSIKRGDLDKFIEELNKNQLSLPDFRSRGGYINHGMLWHPSYGSPEYIVPQKVMRFNFEKGEWDDKD